MTNKDWFQLFDNTKDKFEWFFFQYGYENIWLYMTVERIKENRPKIVGYMNNIWFALPDSKFNILANPPGWNEFLTLLEV